MTANRQRVKLRGWLLQILVKPHRGKLKSKLDKLAEVFSFGGGGSGLTPEATELIYELFAFDYMGAAEYEFGVLPEALLRIAQAKKDLVSFEKTVPAEHIKENEWGRAGFQRENPDAKLPPVQDVTCYVLCRSADRQDVEEIIEKLAKQKQECCVGPRADAFFDPVREWEQRVQGWLDVTRDGGFFIFKDKEMWKNTCLVFTGKEP